MKFERTIIFAKEGGKLKRIGWDLLSVEGMPFMASPMPVAANMFGDTLTTTVSNDIEDMLYDENQNNLIDEVVKIEFFESEADFISRFEGAFGYYTSDPSGEFGYPRL